eukprot:2991925-Karenia_brevis.AAC.2
MGPRGRAEQPQDGTTEPWASADLEHAMAGAQQRFHTTVRRCGNAAARLQKGELEEEERKELLLAVRGIKEAAKKVQLHSGGPERSL